MRQSLALPLSEKGSVKHLLIGGIGCGDVRMVIER